MLSGELLMSPAFSAFRVVLGTLVIDRMRDAGAGVTATSWLRALGRVATTMTTITNAATTPITPEIRPQGRPGDRSLRR